jgi:hypothetical protein
MKKTISLLSNLFLSSILLWGASTVGAAELVVREAASLSLYCHMQIPDVKTGIPSGDRPMVDEATGNDMYRSCDDDTRQDEIKIQQQTTLETYHWAP